MQIVGKDASNVLEVRGLETIRRLSGGRLHLVRQAQPRAALPAVERGPVQVIMAGGFGYGRGWEKLVHHEFPAVEPVARFALGYTQSGLRLWIGVEDDTPFENHGGDLNTLFHTGDAIDFRWATDPELPANRLRPASGDQRFVIAMHEDKPVVVRFIYVDPKSTSKPVEFASPTGVEQVARVTLVKAAKLDLARQPGRYELTVDLRWADLGLDGPPTGLHRGDVGVIFGDPTGNRVVRRCYYFDPGSQEVSDLPSEVRISPARWGEFRF